MITFAVATHAATGWLWNNACDYVESDATCYILLPMGDFVKTKLFATML